MQVGTDDDAARVHIKERHDGEMIAQGSASDGIIRAAWVHDQGVEQHSDLLRGAPEEHPRYCQRLEGSMDGVPAEGGEGLVVRDRLEPTLLEGGGGHGHYISPGVDEHLLG